MGVWYSIGPKGLGVSKWTERLSCWVVYSIFMPYFIPFRSYGSDRGSERDIMEK